MTKNNSWELFYEEGLMVGLPPDKAEEYADHMVKMETARKMLEKTLGGNNNEKE